MEHAAEKPLIARWKATFLDREKEKDYQQKIWSTSVRRYFMLTVTIIVLEFPSLFSRDADIYLQVALQVSIASGTWGNC